MSSSITKSQHITYKLVNDFIIYGGTNAISGLIGLLLLPIYTRTFAPSEYGIIELISVTTTILSTVAGMQLDSALARYFYEKNDNERRILVSTGFILRIFFAVSIFLIFFFLKSDISIIISGSNTYEWPIIISYLTIPLNAIFSYLLIVLRLRHEPVKYGVLAMGNFASTAILCIILIVLFKRGIEGVFLGTLIAGILFTILAVAVSRDHLSMSLSFVYAREMLRYGLPIVPTVIMSWLASYINRFLLLPIIGLGGVGILSVGIKISSVILFFVSSFSLAWLPFSMEIINNDNHRVIYSKALTYYTAILCSFTLILNIVSYEIIHFSIPNTYWGASSLIGILALSSVQTGVLNIVAVGCNIKKKTYLLTLSYICGLVIGILALLFLTPKIGLVGAAMATLISSTTTVVITIYFSQKIYYIEYDIKKITNLMILTSLSLVVTNLINNYDDNSLRLFLKIFESIIFLGGLIAIFGINELNDNIRYMIPKYKLLMKGIKKWLT